MIGLRLLFISPFGDRMLRSLFLTILGLTFANAVLAANPQVEIRTNQGNMVVELYPQQAPKTVENFLGYVKSGFYKGTIFHRVIDNFMIQGGGYDAQLREKDTRAPIQNEANNGLKNEVYTLAMARTGDPHSATAQFFINNRDNAFLNHTSPTARGWGYAVFGKVVKGQEVVQKISKTPTGPKGFFPSDVPRQTILIEDIVLLP